MDDVYDNIEEYNPNKGRKILRIFFDLNFFLIYNTIFFCCAKNYQTKFYMLSYYKNSK